MKWYYYHYVGRSVRKNTGNLMLYLEWKRFFRFFSLKTTYLATLFTNNPINLAVGTIKRILKSNVKEIFKLITVAVKNI